MMYCQCLVREKQPCIYTLYHRYERIVGQAGKNSASAMDIIWDELKSNNVDIDKETLSFHTFVLRHVLESMKKYMGWLSVE